MLPTDVNENINQFQQYHEVAKHCLTYSGSYSCKMLPSENSHSDALKNESDSSVSSTDVLTLFNLRQSKSSSQTRDLYTPHNLNQPTMWVGPQGLNSLNAGKEEVCDNQTRGNSWDSSTENTETHTFRHLSVPNHIPNIPQVTPLISLPTEHQNADIFPNILPSTGDTDFSNCSTLEPSAHRNYHMTSNLNSSEQQLVTNNSFHSGATQLLLGYDRSNNGVYFNNIDSVFSRTQDSKDLSCIIRKSNPNQTKEIFSKSSNDNLSDEDLTRMSVRALNQCLRGHR